MISRLKWHISPAPDLSSKTMDWMIVFGENYGLGKVDGVGV
jgi:hypothetical protein